VLRRNKLLFTARIAGVAADVFENKPTFAFLTKPGK